MLPIAQNLLEDGHDLIGVMTFPCDQIFNFSHNCQALAKHTGATYIESPVSETHIDSLINKGADMFIAAGYPFKIPPINTQKAYGINVHPSVLPAGRGPMPVPHIILNEEDSAAGYTIHKLSPEFDTGDILYKEHIILSDDECVERYCAKILSQAPAKMVDIMHNFEEIWDNASPQDNSMANSYPLPDNATRTLNWSENIQHILRTSRAFGRYGCYAHFAGKTWNVYACEGWVDQHGYENGTCLSMQSNMAVIAAENGFIALKEFQEMTRPIA
ncbi:MAG: hypothetical protein GW778_05340 [Alphaproteobacteria bacterium]|nr:hypothetical protein [Alphaproteobacteria bacterium]